MCESQVEPSQSFTKDIAQLKKTTLASTHHLTEGVLYCWHTLSLEEGGRSCFGSESSIEVMPTKKMVFCCKSVVTNIRVLEKGKN